MNKYCFTLLLILGCFFTQAQDLILDLQRGIAPTDAVQSSITNNDSKATKIHEPFQFVRTDAQDKGIVFLNLKKEVNALLLQAKADDLELAIPVDTEHELVLELHKKDILAPDFVVTTGSGKVDDTFAENSVFYHGKVRGLSKGWATLSIYEGEMTIFINSDKGRLTLGKLTNEETYVFYNEARVVTDQYISCGTEDDLLASSLSNDKKTNSENLKADNCPVGVYIEVDFEGFTNYGQSVQQTTTFTTNLFNQVIAVYENTNIPMQLSGIKIWDTNDPYGNNSPEDFGVKDMILDNFGNILQYNYPGQLAHLVSIQEQGDNTILGLAWLDVICAKSTPNGVPYGLSEVFNSFQTYPTVSGSVSLLAHELGHNFGSRHTHACIWGPNSNQAIDNCSTLEDGPCNVINNRNTNPNYVGSLMSYCGAPTVLEFYTGGGAFNGPREVVQTNYLEAVNDCLGNNCGNGGNCAITSITVGNQTACNPNTNTYTQEVTVSFTNAPGNGNLVVNGQNFAIGTSPRTVTLTGLIANGNPVNVTASFSADPTCISVVNGLFTAPQSCQGGGENCDTYNSGDTPQTIDADAPPTVVTSVINVPAGGTINDVNITLQGMHTWVSDLTFTLQSPQGTMVTLLSSKCDDQDDFNITLDDEAAGAITCPLNAGNTQQPENALSAFNGQNSTGNWTLTVMDGADQDGGQLTNWSLEICTEDVGGGEDGTCASPIVLNCSDNVMGNTANGEDNFQSYNSTDYTGSELIYTFTLANNGTVDIQLTGLNADLDVFLLSACDPVNAIIDGSINGGNDSENINVNVNAGTYFIIVDGYAGAQSTFNLALSCDGGTGNCNTPPPANGTIAAGTYQVTNSMTTGGQVLSPSTVTLKAGGTITLTTGFVAQQGSTFSAAIEVCAAAQDEEEIAFRSEKEAVNVEPTSLAVFPNPFQNQTTITYQLGAQSTVSLEVYDMNGRKIAHPVNNTVQPEGSYQFTFQAERLSKGMYFVFLRTESAVISKRLVLIE